MWMPNAYRLFGRAGWFSKIRPIQPKFDKFLNPALYMGSIKRCQPLEVSDLWEEKKKTRVCLNDWTIPIPRALFDT
jgi:hypothetical protein